MTVCLQSRVSSRPVFFSRPASLTNSPIDNHIEEANMRIMPHIAKSVESGLKKVVVVSNDTDVCALLLHYTLEFNLD